MIGESDPETYRPRIRLEMSASCLKFVIVHYGCVPAAPYPVRLTGHDVATRFVGRSRATGKGRRRRREPRAALRPRAIAICNKCTVRERVFATLLPCDVHARRCRQGRIKYRSSRRIEVKKLIPFIAAAAGPGCRKRCAGSRVDRGRHRYPGRARVSRLCTAAARVLRAAASARLLRTGAGLRAAARRGRRRLWWLLRSPVLASRLRRLGPSRLASLIRAARPGRVATGATSRKGRCAVFFDPPPDLGEADFDYTACTIRSR